MALLELKGVCKSYDGEARLGRVGARTDVLRNIDLAVEPGEFVAIVGYSGAGKSTLMSLMAGLIPADSGTMTFDGKPIREPGPERGVVFQNYSLLPWLTVFENVYLAVDQVFSDWTVARKRAHTDQHVALVNLTPARDKRPAQLSGGMRQRVALARGLAMDPQVLLLDEPLGALDALTRAVLQDELARLCQASGKTIVLITNDVDEAILLADRIVPLGAGPAATLGPSFAVEVARPRDRKALNHDAAWKRVRAEIIDYLLSSAKASRKRAAAPSTPLLQAALEPAE
ncbi:MAG TPA: ABC transporter ATP-binding protein [Polyangiales bacterium]|nr:ABC transporter ATP-binding protein [Polyangiales bacterium]